MEAAIQTLVKVFLKSAKGKESLGKKEFQGLVSSQLSNILSVRKSLRKNLSEISLALCNQPLEQKQTHLVASRLHRPVLTCREFLFLIYSVRVKRLLYM